MKNKYYKKFFSIFLSILLIFIFLPYNYSHAQTTDKIIAVVEFSNDTGDSKYDNLKRGLSESLITKLARYKDLKVVERTKLDLALKEIGFSQSVHVDTDSAVKIGKMIGANAIVTGNIVKAGSKFEINIRMFDVETSKILVSEGTTFNSEDDILLVVEYLSLRIPNGLGMYVNIDDLMKAKEAIKTSTNQNTTISSGGDNSWIIWTVVGVVVVSGGVIIVLAATGNLGSKQSQSVNQSQTINNINSSINPNIKQPQLNFLLLNF